MLKGYVKNTSNCEGLPLGWDADIEVVKDHGAKECLVAKTGDDLTPRKIVGWTDLFMGQPCSVHLYEVNWQGHNGFLLCGGNSGIRVIANEEDEDFREEYQAHLPNGWGLPIMFIEDKNDYIGDQK